MSVLEVFGQNLRDLTALRGSQAQVSEELDINRIQFGRYLRSESFPKPNVLKRICDYFDVDARIVTERLTPGQLEMIGAGAGKLAAIVPNPSAMNEAITYCASDQAYFDDNTGLPDGIYQFWRRAFARPDCAVKMLIKIASLNHARVIRGYDPVLTYFDKKNYRGQAREFRGMLLRQRVGYASVSFHHEPSRVVSVSYFEPVDTVTGSFAAGFSMIARAERPDCHRVSRSIISRIEGGWADVMRVARLPSFIAWEDVPTRIRPYIFPAGETF